jgi:hypothetical protein
MGDMRNIERDHTRLPRLPKTTGYLAIYQRTVQPMSTRAVLVRDEP